MSDSVLVSKSISQSVVDPEGPPGDRYVGTLFPYLSANLDFSGDGLAGLFEDQVVDATAGAGARTIAPAASGNSKTS